MEGKCMPQIVTEDIYELLKLNLASLNNNEAIIVKSEEGSRTITYSQLNAAVETINHHVKYFKCTCSNSTIAVKGNLEMILYEILACLKMGVPFFCYLDDDVFLNCENRFYACFYLTDRKLTCNKERFKLLKTIPIYSSEIFLYSSNHNCSISRSFNEKIAYIARTSGTTGEKKLVYVPHMCIVPNIKHLISLWKISKTDVIFLSSPCTFDPFIIEIFLAFITGACLLIVTNNIKIIPKSLCQTLMDSKCSVLQVTPSIFNSFNTNLIKSFVLHESSPIRVLAIGGEEMNFNIFKIAKHTKNMTVIYNIYGITEMSCWQSLVKINLIKLNNGSAPIYEKESQLCDTELKLLNEDLTEIIENEISGNIYVMSSSRFCYIDLEEDCNLPKLGEKYVRKTGDVGILIDGKMYFKSRHCDIIKRNSIKISVKSIQDEIKRIVNANWCCVIYYEQKYLFCFFLKFEFLEVSERQLMKNLIDNNLDTIMLPTHIIFTDNIPKTNNGKLDKEYLQNYALETMSNKLNQTIFQDDISLEVTEIWKLFLKQTPSINSNFISSGGDSFLAINFVQQTETTFNQKFPQLLEFVLHKDVREILEYILKTLLQSNKISDTTYVMPSKRPKTCCDVGDTALNNNAVRALNPSIKNSKFKKNSLKIRVKWIFDTRKCIDATPLLVTNLENKNFVLIGSHSGLFTCLTLDGTKVWSIDLKNRIESSAKSNEDRSLVFVGCYDGLLYAIIISTGVIKWKFQTGDIIKCSPAVILFKIESLSTNVPSSKCSNKTAVIESNSSNGKNEYVLFGSYDKHLYIVNSQNGKLIWKKNPHNSSILASPLVLEGGKSFFIACLDGFTALYSTEGYMETWKKEINAPIFTNPIQIDKNIIFGCVNKLLYCLDSTSGDTLWTYTTNGPIFSSPIVASHSNLKLILFGCNDCYSYCITEKGSLKWKYKMSDPIVSRPSLYQSNSIFISNKGNIFILALDTGDVLCEKKLSGMIYSSPVVFGNEIFVGCRDNNQYGLKILNSL